MNKSKNAEPKQTSGAELIVSEPCGLLDFLIVKLTNKSRNNVKALLANKAVSVDGTVVTKYDFALAEGQKIRIGRFARKATKLDELLNILFEDEDIIVMNKAAGLLSIASDTQKDRTAYHMMTDFVRRDNPKNRIFVVHRLDRDTSGVLLFAKNEKMKLALQDNWAELVKYRGYVAVVEGQLENEKGRIKSWLKETKTLLVYSAEKKSGGQEAITNYEVLKENTNYSMLSVVLETGRKNQIRVHMKELGHTVIGDKKYGSKVDPLKRLGLHANKLILTHPFTNKVMCFEAPPPKCFEALFEKSAHTITE